MHKTVATGAALFGAPNRFSAGALSQTPLGKLTAFPRPLAVFWRGWSPGKGEKEGKGKGRKGEGKEGTEGKREGKVEEGKRRRKEGTGGEEKECNGRVRRGAER